MISAFKPVYCFMYSYANYCNHWVCLGSNLLLRCFGIHIIPSCGIFACLFVCLVGFGCFGFSQFILVLGTDVCLPVYLTIDFLLKFIVFFWSVYKKVPHSQWLNQKSLVYFLSLWFGRHFLLFIVFH